MKNLKKYISVLAAVFMLAAYASFPAYAQFDSSPTDEVEDEESDPDDVDEIIPIEVEDEDDTAPTAEDIEFVDPPDEEEEEDVIDVIEVISTEAATTTADMVVEIDVTTTEAVTTAADTTAAAPVDSIPPYNPVDEHTMYAIETVNIRYGPDTSYSKLGTAYASGPVTVIGSSGGWYAISYNGTVGFVSASYFTDQKPETTTQPLPLPHRRPSLRK
ncbi:MAG: SH3 domain-containing protein [Ruminiclostridium sp.]|nr:SH3 domain-containing protein [Ruminiclostridium sp.]